MNITHYQPIRRALVQMDNGREYIITDKLITRLAHGQECMISIYEKEQVERALKRATDQINAQAAKSSVWRIENLGKIKRSLAPVLK